MSKLYPKFHALYLREKVQRFQGSEVQGFKGLPAGFVAGSRVQSFSALKSGIFDKVLLIQFPCRGLVGPSIG